MEGIFKRIVEIRKERKISQKEISKSLGITQAAYAKIETGKSPLTIDRLYKIADLLGVTIGDFLEIELTKQSTSKEIERLRNLVIETIYKYESNKVFLEQFEYDQENKEERAKFLEIIFMLHQFRQGLFDALINVEFCTKDDITRYYVNKINSDRNKRFIKTNLESESSIIKDE